MTKTLSIIALLAAVMLFGTGCKGDKNEPTTGDKQGTETGSGTGTGSSTTQEGALAGVFSVSDTKQVQFSKGNLEYQESTKTWRFAENQWDIIGNDNSNFFTVYNYSGWIDFFGWGTGNNPTNASTNYIDYSTFTDWGVKAISNGGNTADSWRTLTNSEWEYLFNTRTNASSLRGQAVVNGIYGYVLLPDGWTTPSSLSFTACPNNWTTNVYSSTAWAKMESADAVFLPCAGSRNGKDMVSVGLDGNYWSSTDFGKDGARYVGFGEGSAHAGYWIYRYNGLSVRLVQDVKE